MITPESIQKHIEKQIAIAMCGKNVRGATISDGCEVDVLTVYHEETDTFEEIYRMKVPQFNRAYIPRYLEGYFK